MYRDLLIGFGVVGLGVAAAYMQLRNNKKLANKLLNVLFELQDFAGLIKRHPEKIEEIQISSPVKKNAHWFYPVKINDRCYQIASQHQIMPPAHAQPEEGSELPQINFQVVSGVVDEKLKAEIEKTMSLFAGPHGDFFGYHLTREALFDWLEIEEPQEIQGKKIVITNDDFEEIVL